MTLEAVYNLSEAARGFKVWYILSIIEMPNSFNTVSKCTVCLIIWVRCTSVVEGLLMVHWGFGSVCLGGPNEWILYLARVMSSVTKAMYVLYFFYGLYKSLLAGVKKE